MGFERSPRSIEQCKNLKMENSYGLPCQQRDNNRDGGINSFVQPDACINEFLSAMCAGATF